MNIKQFSKEITVLMLALIVAVGSYLLWDRHTYHDTANPKATLTKASKTKAATTLIFHKTGCADCRAVVTDVNRGIRNNANTDFVVVDTKDSDLYKRYNVVSVPTIIKLHNGHEVSRYSGTNKAEIANILADEAMR
ncbi:thioredoxin family protein [Weissella cibaria]|uniref:thioredoxin family protein n=1 Tax=Weissella cibaria TaxID=137591 RepID=UPI0022E16B82|nr:thioredoxin family protein [Weissella cibaria]